VDITWPRIFQHWDFWLLWIPFLFGAGVRNDLPFPFPFPFFFFFAPPPPSSDVTKFGNLSIFFNLFLFFVVGFDGN